MPHDVQFTLNGRAVSAEPHEDESLLEMLRERFGLTTLKDGCAPQGQCGCCLALIDGVAKVTCVMPARSVEGRSILTLEGLDEADRHLFARAFAVTGGVQCGFCTPGIALRAKYLLDHHPTRRAWRSRRPSTCTCAGARAMSRSSTPSS